MNSVTDPALDMLNRALSGDENALAFLDRTSSIYVLDATDASNPKTYGGWNFIHQALNELERHERNYGSNGTTAGPGLRSHVQLLAAMSQRVARRSPASDRKLVVTCVDNAAQYHVTADEAEALIVLNSEIREIVMGRIAAMVFDFSFHNPNGPHLSAFSDPVAMESLCSVLSANAVSCGPQAISHFMLEWIIPSVRILPPFAVACVILHLGSEATRKVAPAGTKEMLQRMSSAIMAIVIAPVLCDAILESGDARGLGSNHERHSRVAAISIRSIEGWCAATELSLPQIKHVCSKVNLNMVEILSDAMYSDSQLVIEAVAELFDRILVKREKKSVCRERMIQTRYVMEVDEAAFLSISVEDINRIESKEMDAIVLELVSAIGLQRFRFAERQENGDLAGCRCLARIAVSVCKACIDSAETSHLPPFATGMVDLLLKAAAHPMVNVCGIALEALSGLADLDQNFPLRFLPILQHRAIIPHITNGGLPSVEASEVCGVDIHEFDRFRSTILSNALVSCYKRSPDYYMNSCTAAVEEFCTAPPTVKTSFQLEAALYCLGAVASGSISVGQILMGPSTAVADTNLRMNSTTKNQLSRCTAQLEKKPVCVTANPLTLAQTCRFVGKHVKWYVEDGNDLALEIAAELCLSAMTTSLLLVEATAQKMMQEMSVSPFSEASFALHLLLEQKPTQFATEQALKALGVGWEAAYMASNRVGAVTIEAREALCKGLCSVLASLPSSQRARPLQILFIPTIECLRAMTKMADESAASVQGNGQNYLDSILVRVADEIRILSTMVRTFSRVTSRTSDMQDQGSQTPTGEEPYLTVLRQAWPSISHVAETFNKNESVSEALGKFLVGCLPSDFHKGGMSLLNELCSLSSSILTNADGSKVSVRPIVEFVTEFVNIHGSSVEKSVIDIVDQTRDANDGEDESGRLLEGLLMSLIEASRSALGTNRAGKHQGQGQQPFESKAQPEPDDAQGSIEDLSGIFSILTACALKCPVFLIHLHLPTRAMGHDEAKVVGRAVESAAAALAETDVETLGTAMRFLESTIKLSSSESHASIQQPINEILSKVRRGIIFEVIDGICGKFHQTLLELAANLLFTAVRSFPPTKMRACLRPAIEQETFLLGEHAQRVSLQVLDGCSQGVVPLEMLRDLVVDVWELHQVDDIEAIANSDMMLRFTADRYHA